MSYRSIFNIKKGHFTRFHTPYKEGTGVGPLLEYTKDFKPIYKYVLADGGRIHQY